MVRAILEERKTQTRRVVKPQPPDKFQFAQDGTMRGVTAFWWTDRDIDLDDIGWWPGYDDQDAVKCPYGSPGDRLWVRETWAPHADMPHAAIYRCDRGGDLQDTVTPNFRWRPSIFMPRWASRITLEIVSVRVERLQDISEEDARGEGIARAADGYWFNYAPDGPTIQKASDSYRTLWESINGPGSWDRNDWVWAIEFRKA